MSVRFVYGFEYEQHADAFLAGALAAGFEAALDERNDSIEGVGVNAEPSAEPRLDHLAERHFGYSLGGRPAL